MNKFSSPLILIVDDLPVNLQVLGNVLKEEDYEIAVASSGNQALAILEHITPDLVLLDVMMPGLDGYTVCHELKKNPRLADIPVVFLTAKAEPDDIVRGFEVGSVDYVKKPFNVPELLARVQTHIELVRSRKALSKAHNDLRNAYKQLEVLARTDPLTNLWNRLAMHEKIKLEENRFERNKTTFSLALCDIDSFKLFNDEYGHDVGDFVLVSVADAIKSRLRKIDQVSRWGGEEFLILYPETSLKGAQVITERVREYIAEKVFKTNGLDLSITITFGIITFDGTRTVDECISLADKALYEGKKKGKNVVIAASV